MVSYVFLCLQALQVRDDRNFIDSVILLRIFKNLDDFFELNGVCFELNEVY